MSDPSNPQGDWQQVPSTPVDPASQAYPPPSQGYPPPPPGSYPPPPAGYPPPPQGGYPPIAPPPQSSPMSPTSVAAISYLTFIPALIFLLTDPYKQIPFVRFQRSGASLQRCLIRALDSIHLPLIPFHVVESALMQSTIHSAISSAAHHRMAHLHYPGELKGKWFKLPILGDIAPKQSGQ